MADSPTNILLEIAGEAKDLDVYRTTVKKLADLGSFSKLTDQALLVRIAVEDDAALDLNLRRAAVEKLTDQALIARVAVEGDDGDVCLVAVENLTDQALLAKVAQEASL